jgi:hypothetical protein
VHAFVETVRVSRMREICTSGLKRGAEPHGSAPTRLCFGLSWFPAFLASEGTWLETAKNPFDSLDERLLDLLYRVSFLR